MCPYHYFQKRRKGETTLKKEKRSTCRVEGCENKPKSLGLCPSHYSKYYKGKIDIEGKPKK